MVPRLRAAPAGRIGRRALATISASLASRHVHAIGLAGNPRPQAQSAIAAELFPEFPEIIRNSLRSTVDNKPDDNLSHVPGAASFARLNGNPMPLYTLLESSHTLRTASPEHSLHPGSARNVYLGVSGVFPIRAGATDGARPDWISLARYRNLLSAGSMFGVQRPGIASDFRY